MSAAWRSFFAEIGCWRDAGQEADFWWRDDDASRASPALDRLIALADATQTPLALAVIPDGVQAGEIATHCPMVTLLQHGVDHVNRAMAGEKKTEFAASEPVAAALSRLAQGRQRLRLIADGEALPVLVPPWNRIASAPLVAQLAGAGYCGLSTFGPRRSPLAAPGLAQVNTHVDIIDWRGGRGFAGEDLVLAQATQHLHSRRSGQSDIAEPTGWLTHHAVHDAAAWAFMERLLERTRDLDAVRWRGAADLFGQA